MDKMKSIIPSDVDITYNGYKCGSILVNFTQSNEGSEVNRAIEDAVTNEGIDLTLITATGEQVSIVASRNIAVLDTRTITVTDLPSGATTKSSLLVLDKTVLVIICAVGGALLIIIVFAWTACLIRRRKSRRREQEKMERANGNVDYSMCDIAVSHRMSRMAGYKIRQLINNPKRTYY